MLILINSSQRNTVRIFQDLYPIHPPVGVGYLVAMAQREGIPVDFIDEQVVPDVCARVEERVREAGPPLVFGFSVLTSAMGSAVAASGKLKERYPGSTIVFGGIHPTLAPDEVLAHPHVDFVIRGEAEGPLTELYRCLEAGRDPRHIDNLSYRRDGLVIHNPLNYIVRDVDAVPPFPYHLFTHAKYDMGFVIGSRGCPYQCIFCSARAMPGSAIYRHRSPTAIVGEIKLLIERYGISSIIFVDDNFLVSRKRIYALLDEMKRQGLAGRAHYTFQARGDSVEPQLLKDMRGVGFDCVLFGLETASEAVMRTIKKGETVADCVEGVKMAKAAGMSIGATFVFGLPGETHADRMDAVRMSRRLQLDVVRFNNAIPYPGTELYASAKREGRLQVDGLYANFIAVSGITESPFRKIPFAYVPAGTTANELRRDILLAHFLIYLDLPRTLRILFVQGTSAKWVNVGGSFLNALKRIPPLISLAFLMGIKFLQMFYYLLLKPETRLPAGYLVRLLRSVLATRPDPLPVSPGKAP